MQPTFRVSLCKPVCYYIRPKIVAGADLAYIQRGPPKFINHAKWLEIQRTQILSELQLVPETKSITTIRNGCAVMEEILNIIDLPDEISCWSYSQWGCITPGWSLKHPLLLSLLLFTPFPSCVASSTPDGKFMIHSCGLLRVRAVRNCRIEERCSPCSGSQYQTEVALNVSIS